MRFDVNINICMTLTEQDKLELSQSIDLLNTVNLKLAFSLQPSFHWLSGRWHISIRRWRRLFRAKRGGDEEAYWT